MSVYTYVRYIRFQSIALYCITLYITHTHTHIYIYIHISLYLYTCKQICTNTQTHTHTYTHLIYTCVRRTCISICACARARTCICANTLVACAYRFMGACYGTCIWICSSHEQRFGVHVINAPIRHGMDIQCLRGIMGII